MVIVLALLAKFDFEIYCNRTYLVNFKNGQNMLIDFNKADNFFERNSIMSIMTMILFSFILISPFIAHAYQNEPDNFRGIKWGTNIKELPDMTKSPDNNELYVRNNDKFQIGDADLTLIKYGFYKERFYSVWINYESSSNFRKLKDTLFLQFGIGNQPNQFIEQYYWGIGSQVTISLQFNEMKDNGFILFVYNPIREEIINDDKDKAKKAASDL